MDFEIFSNQNFKIRGGLINSEPYFVAKDICDMLDISNSRDALSGLDDDEKGVAITDTVGGKQNMAFVNESGLYSLIFRSRKQEAKQFKKWVTSEVLPSIRKNGMYATDVTIDKMIADPDFAIQLLTNLKEEKQARLQAEKLNAILLHTKKLYTTTEISKEIGLKSAKQLNKILSDNHIQFLQNNTWVLYSKYSDRGYTSIKQEVLDNGKIIYDRKWTDLGREFILKLFEVHNG